MYALHGDLAGVPLALNLDLLGSLLTIIFDMCR